MTAGQTRFRAFRVRVVAARRHLHEGAARRRARLLQTLADSERACPLHVVPGPVFPCTMPSALDQWPEWPD